ncbi:MAG: polysaccharide deacetylase family protein [Lachnospiraceae bacterium]|nr:polysaccharide deacetylase family protein [Lachnospiraceae bacterium]
MEKRAAVRRGRKNIAAQEAKGTQAAQAAKETQAAKEAQEARKRLEAEQRKAEARKQKEAEEEQQRLREEEAERLRREEEEAKRLREEERKRAEEEERRRAEEEAERLRREEEEERERRRRQAEERRRRAEEERRRAEEAEERIEAEVERRLYKLREEEAAKVVVSPRAVRARRGTVLAAIAAVLMLGAVSVFLGIRYDAVRKERDAAMEDLAWYRSLVSGEVIEETGMETGTAPEQTEENVVPKDGLRRVYLTFDDGPTAVTDEVLDILKEYDVKATFFVLGRDDEASKKRYNRIVDEGHTLAMHSFDHDFSRLYASLDSFSADTLRLRNFLYDVTDGRVWSKIYRFPGGSSTTTARAEIPELIDWLGREDITYFDWNVYGGDDIAPEAIVSNVVANVGKYENAVILMHDGADKRETVEALPEILEYLQGLDNTVLLPITEDTTAVQHGNM